MTRNISTPAPPAMSAASEPIRRNDWRPANGLPPGSGTTYPVTAFEALLLAQDSPRRPLTAPIEIAYDGHLDGQHARTALQHVLASHPLLQSTVDNPKQPRTWTVHPGTLPFLDWDSQEARVRFPEEKEWIDLTQEFGLRVWIRQGNGQGRLTFQVHHACTDGIGVMSFILDFLRTYAEIAAGNPPPDLGRPTQALARRETYQHSSPMSRWNTVWGLANRFGRWRRLSPIALGTPRPHVAIKSPLQSIVHRSLPDQFLQRLLQSARRQNATLNDLLLRDLFLTLNKAKTDLHSATHDPEYSSSNESLVLCMPVNLRQQEDASMPSANKLMLTFLHRTSQDCEQPDELLSGIHSETQTIKKTLRGVKILFVIKWALRLFGRIPARLLNKTSFATAVLSNLGRVDAAVDPQFLNREGLIEIGGLTIRDFITAPNGLAGTSVVFVASSYAGKLFITLWHDASRFSSEEIEQLMDQFTQQLEHSATT